jgi:hypothetical protein
MKTKKILTLLFLLFPLYLIAQNIQDSEKTVQYTMLIEGGISSGSPVSICGEFFFMHGIKVNNKHLYALALGIGGGLIQGYGDANWRSNPFYMPFYFNYRYFFNQQKKTSPFISANLGGLMNYSLNHYYGGFYSSLAVGIQVRKFYIMGGINFTPMISNIKREENIVYWEPVHKTIKQWVFPVGIMLHVGVAF